MNEKKSNTTKTLFIFVIIVAVIAGIYVLKMNMVNNLLGIGTPASTAATTPAAKSTSDSTLVPGGTMSPAPTETPAAVSGSTAPSTPPSAKTPDTPSPAPQTTPAQTAPTDKKSPGKKAVG